MDDVLEVALRRVRARRRLPPPEARRQLREQAGLTQGQLGAALGVSDAAVSQWETGNRIPRGDRAERYLALLTRLGREKR